jgi:hypothetical protein
MVIISGHKINPETGKPALSSRENKTVDGFVANGGDAARAATCRKPARIDEDPSRPIFLSIYLNF